MVDTSRTSTIGLFRYARSYFHSAEFLLSCQKDTLSPRLFLYAHSIELGLKCFLFEKSGKIEKTHDLLKLQENADSLGFEFSTAFKGILEILNRLNRDDFRTKYFKRGPTTIPHDEILSKETTGFFESLTSYIPDAKIWIERHG